MRYPFRNLVFQGGGIKAFAYHGALHVLQKRGILDQIERVAGSSAGAAIATFVAMRLEVDQIIQHYQSFDFNRITHGRAANIPPRDSSPNFLQRELDRIQASFASVTRLATKFGWYSSEYGYRWMKEVLAEYCGGNGDVTFGQFRELGFLDLYIVVTNLSAHRTEVLSAETTPDAAIADAVLITQALPIFFESVQFDGTRLGRGDHYLDGGLLVNYPLQLFDDHKFSFNNRWFVNGINWETIGCRTYTPKECHPRGAPISNLISYVQNVFEVMIDVQSAAFQLNKAAQRRTININDCCVRATDWDIKPNMDDERYSQLFSNGESAAYDYLDDYVPPVIKPILPFSWYLDRRWREFKKWLDNHG